MEKEKNKRGKSERWEKCVSAGLYDLYNSYVSTCAYIERMSCMKLYKTDIYTLYSFTSAIISTGWQCNEHIERKTVLISSRESSPLSGGAQI